MQSKQSVAKDVFAYLLTFVMLYLGVIHLISLLWLIILVQFPDPASWNWMNPYDSMRNSIASLIIVWPVFLLMSRYLVGDLKRNPQKIELWVRRWLTYLTIFVSSVTIIIDLITLLNSFLGGELTTRFVLKVIVVLLVAASVLGYEFWELKRKPEEGKKQMRLMVIGSAIVILASIVVGFYFVGTPKAARQQKFDSERVSDLQTLQNQLITYWNQKGQLPDDLSALRDPLLGFEIPLDPETNESYMYKKTGELTFDLCATFARETPVWERVQNKPSYMMYDDFGNPTSDTWDHNVGEKCYERTIDPERHKTPKI
jgi:hypothetical protein